MGHLHLEDMLISHPFLYFFYHTHLNFFFFFIAMRLPALSKFHLDYVQRALSFTDRMFHYLVTLRRLASWELGPEPTEEALAHKLTNQRREFFPSFFFTFFFFKRLSCPNTEPPFFSPLPPFFRNGNHEGEQRERCC